MKKTKEKSFEDLFKRLEDILELLESEKCTLDDTIRLYEEGLTLAKLCSEILNKAELKISEISKSIKGETEIKDYR
jgi:exodeoxyribonuclease VII small subunit